MAEQGENTRATEKCYQLNRVAAPVSNWPVPSCNLSRGSALAPQEQQIRMFEQTFKNIDDILHKDAGCTSELD